MDLPWKDKRGTWDDKKGQHLNETKVDEVKDAGNYENSTIRETSDVSTPITRENVAVNEKNDFEEGAPSKNILPLSMCFNGLLLFFFHAINLNYYLKCAHSCDTGTQYCHLNFHSISILYVSISFTEHETDTINHRQKDVIKQRKLNCNLCEDIFSSMLGLNAHMKTHPEVIFFVLQLLDNDSNINDSITDDPLRVRCIKCPEYLHY